MESFPISDSHKYALTSPSLQSLIQDLTVLSYEKNSYIFKDFQTWHICTYHTPMLNAKVTVKLL